MRTNKSKKADIHVTSIFTGLAAMPRTQCKNDSIHAPDRGGPGQKRKERALSFK